jgi:hypothetical protein
VVAVQVHVHAILPIHHKISFLQVHGGEQTDEENARTQTAGDEETDETRNHPARDWVLFCRVPHPQSSSQL